MTEHIISVVPRRKMDTPTGLFGWTCSCGDFGTGVHTEAGARRSGDDHRLGKALAARKRVLIINRQNGKSELQRRFEQETQP